MIDTVGDVLRAVVRVVFAVSCVAALASCSKSSSSAQNYVALGDSYAAGTLTGEISGDPAGCLRSEKDYPHVVQHTLAAKAFTDVTCSSATSADLGGPQHVAGGTNPPQLDAITSSTTLVTLTIGGNDIGFLSIIEHCASLTPSGSPCKDHYTSGGTDQLSRRIAATAPKIAAVLAAVHSRAPKARILLVGYPDLLPPGGGCWPKVPFTDADSAYLGHVELALNAMLAAQAAAGHATYVDTYTPSLGHDMCTESGVRWVEPLLPTSLAAPFHPNAEGEKHMAAAVTAAIAGH